MALLSEGNNIADIVKWEQNQDYSRKLVSLTSGSLAVGAAIGIKDSSNSVATGTNTGGGTCGTVTLGRLALPGDYVLTCKTKATGAGVFSVVTPKGEALADLTVGVAYAGDHINCTVADGSPDFEVGDKFTITVVGGGTEVVEYNPAGSAGAQYCRGVLAEALDASAATVYGVAVVRQAILSAQKIAWKTGMTAPQKVTALAQLEERGILARDEA